MNSCVYFYHIIKHVRYGKIIFERNTKVFHILKIILRLISSHDMFHVFSLMFLLFFFCFCQSLNLCAEQKLQRNTKNMKTHSYKLNFTIVTSFKSLTNRQVNYFLIQAQSVNFGGRYQVDTIVSSTLVCRTQRIYRKSSLQRILKSE